MKILLIGKNGQLGSCIQEQFHSFYSGRTDVVLVAYDSSKLNITEKSNVVECIARELPDVIINASAYTNVDKAESDSKDADRVNHLGVVLLGEVSAQYDVPVIHISTDYVFDGDSIFPYKPEDALNPKSVYGRTKLAGEMGLQATNPQHVIVRTAWVFSEFGNNFVKTMIRLSEKDSLGVVADQYGCPTYAGDLAKCILTLCESILKSNMEWGVYHYCGDTETSWHGFAKAVFSIAHQCDRIKSIPTVKAINTEEYPVPAVRPKFSVLNCQKLEKYDIYPSNWRQALVDIMPTL